MMLLVELRISLSKNCYSRTRTLEGTTCCHCHPLSAGPALLLSTADQRKQKLPEASKYLKHFLAMCDFCLSRTKGPNLDTGIGYSTKLHI